MSDSPTDPPIPPDILRLWPDVIEAACKDLSPRIANDFIRCASLVSVDDRFLVASLSSKFKIERNQQTYASRWTEALMTVGIVGRQMRFVITKAGDMGAPRGLETLTPERLSEVEEKSKKKEEQQKRREDRRLLHSTWPGDDPPPFLRLPVALLFPLRVLRVPRRKVVRLEELPDGSNNRIEEYERMPLQNVWIGNNGSFVHVIYGGTGRDGQPWGIPGHSLPLAIDMYLCTEYSLQFKGQARDSGTDGLRIGLGTVSRAGRKRSYLPKCAADLGLRGNYRGGHFAAEGERARATKPETLIRRVHQYARCRHRVLMCGSIDQGYLLYLALRAIAQRREDVESIPADIEVLIALVEAGIPVQLGPREERLYSDRGQYRGVSLENDSTIELQSDYNIWDECNLGWPGVDGFMAHFTLSQDFADKMVKRGVPIPTELVSRLMRNAQDLALAVVMGRLVDSMIKRNKPSVTLSVQTLQDQLGLNGTQEHRRSGPTLDSLNRVRMEWNFVAETIMGRPRAKLLAQVHPATTHKGAAVTFHSSERLVELDADDEDDSDMSGRFADEEQ